MGWGCCHFCSYTCPPPLSWGKWRSALCYLANLPKATEQCLDKDQSHADHSFSLVFPLVVHGIYRDETSVSRTWSGIDFPTSSFGKQKQLITNLGSACDQLCEGWPTFCQCFIIHFVFSSSNPRVPQEAVTAGFLDEVHWSFGSLSHVCRQDDEAAGYQFCCHCEWGMSRACRNRYLLPQKKLFVIKMENAFVLGFTQLSLLCFPTPGGLFGHGSKMLFES